MMADKPLTNTAVSDGAVKHKNAQTHSVEPAGAVKTMSEQMQQQSENAADLLKAMANAQRLRILCLLIEGERP